MGSSVGKITLTTYRYVNGERTKEVVDLSGKFFYLGPDKGTLYFGWGRGSFLLSTPWWRFEGPNGFFRSLRVPVGMFWDRYFFSFKWPWVSLF